jgi:hypothetical protein
MVHDSLAPDVPDVPANANRVNPMRDDEPAAGPGPEPCHPHAWKSLLAADLRREALARPWGPAVMAVGWVHLAFFLACQASYTAGVRAKWPSLLLWGSELATVLAAVRWVAGPAWFRESPAVGLVLRVWVTFLILSFNVASLNTLTGFSLDWFKPVWCTLSSFGFATMAWLFGARYLVPAFQMYFTGLLMVRFPEWNYVIYGASWCAALQLVGLDLSRRRARLLLPDDGEAPARDGRFVTATSRPTPSAPAAARS